MFVRQITAMLMLAGLLACENREAGVALGTLERKESLILQRPMKSLSLCPLMKVVLSSKGKFWLS